MLIQGLRALLPFGEMWTPILDNLVQLINTLQGESLERVSFYKATTAFVNDLKNDDSYKHIQITGHSLGGGIAIITGAQSGIPAVAVSGPNARLSGSSFVPRVTHEQLDRYTFNIVPARDPVARFDDVANQFQRIRCNAEPNRFMDCHTGGRSLCELMYTCGSGNRPIPCWCYTTYGFPEPTAYPDARPVDEVCPPTT
jgi:lipase ATG15